MVKSTTDKLVPASMVQNEPVFKLHRDVVDTMISGAGGFAAILHRHRSADRFRRTVLVLASCVDGTPRISKELVQNFERKCGATICKDLKGIETGKVLCPCPECVRNAVLSLGEALGE